MEYSARGLKPDREPNAYGLEMEALTDGCGLAWDDRHYPSGERHTDDSSPRKRGQVSDLIDSAR
jgi:hypothetical protein